MAAPGRTIPPLLKTGLDLGPLLLFFIANAYFDIFVATGTFMAAVTVVLAIGFGIERKLSPIPVVTAVLVFIFGGLTLWLANDIFIKIKPTILYAIFATVLVGGLYFKRIFLKLLLGQSMRLSDAAWRMLTWRWAVFFLSIGTRLDGHVQVGVTGHLRTPRLTPFMPSSSISASLRSPS